LLLSRYTAFVSCRYMSWWHRCHLATASPSSVERIAWITLNHRHRTEFVTSDERAFSPAAWKSLPVYICVVVYNW